MTSKEIVRVIIHHTGAPRLGWDFYDPRYRDIGWLPSVAHKSPCGGKYDGWGDYQELKALSGFNGDVRLDMFGNVYGRLGQKTKGECVHGALEDGWEQFADFRFPELDQSYSPILPDDQADKYIIASVTAVFAPLRDTRLMTNALMDTVLEPEMVTEFLSRLTDMIVSEIEMVAGKGADGVIMYDDWGTQIAPLISPATFVELFKPAYAKVGSAAHARGLDYILHSCGKVQSLVDDLIEAGVDMFQFDQPELSGVEYWARNYGHKCAFYSPVDIQKIMPAGDRDIVTEGAKRMADEFRRNGGSLVVKDYGGPDSYNDINVEPEMVNLARETIIANSWID